MRQNRCGARDTPARRVTLRLQDVYRGSAYDTLPVVYSVCHMSDTDTLLVYYVRTRVWQNVRQLAGGAASQRQRVARDTSRAASGRIEKVNIMYQCCALSDSRALVGCFGWVSPRIWSCSECRAASRIERLQRIDVDNAYQMLFRDERRRRRRHARGDVWREADRSLTLWSSYEALNRCECIACAETKTVYPATGGSMKSRAFSWENPCESCGSAIDCSPASICDETKSYAVVELVLNGTRLERRRELIASSERFRVYTWSSDVNSTRGSRPTGRPTTRPTGWVGSGARGWTRWTRAGQNAGREILLGNFIILLVISIITIFGGKLFKILKFSIKFC